MEVNKHGYFQDTLCNNGKKMPRMDRHWTQEELAEKLSVSPTYLGDLERHKGTPSLSFVL